MGVTTLSNATPVDTGETAASWYYEIKEHKGYYSIVWHNSHVVAGRPIAILLQYGHGTGTGGYVMGRDFIMPAIRPVFDRMSDDAWREVTKVLMATIDDKVVAMSFESSKFESGVNSSINALNKLKSALTFGNAGKGLDEIDDSAKKVDLSPIAKAIDAIKSKFSALSVIALTALTNIVNKAVDAGLKLVKSLTLDPIMEGFKNYETRINAVQTIMANTGLSGKKGLGQVNAVLAELNTYANKTVYNFSEMAKNIGTFTAAGVGLKTSAESIKGIANLAALSGSTSDQASMAMYQLSQAIAANQVKLQDWNSVVNAGMGGKVFQKALFTTGKALGTIKGTRMDETFGQWTKAGNTFRGSLQSGWLTGKVLTTTLKGFTGDLTAAQLKSMGYTADQAKQIQKLGIVARNAATKIKTMTQLQQALKEEVATAWSAIFSTIFGNILQATSLFSKIHTVAEKALTQPIYNLNRLLEAWAKLGGRSLAIDALKNAFKALADVMKPIKEAFFNIFPPETGKQLYDLTKKFDDFTKSLIPSPKTVDDLKRTFQGLFALLDIGKQIVSGIFIVFGKLFGAVTKGGSGFLDLTGSIGDFLVSVDNALKKGGQLHSFFETLGNIIAAPIRVLGMLKDALVSVFTGVDPKASAGFSGAMAGIVASLAPLRKILDVAKRAWDKFVQGMGQSGPTLQKAVDAIVQLFANLGTDISNAIQNTDISGILTVIRTGLIGGIFLLIKKFVQGGFAKGLGGGIIASVGESFEALTGSMVAMQQSIKAATLMEIAAALGILTASIVALSFIPADKVSNAMATLTIAMGELLGAMALLDKIGDSKGFLKLPIIASSMVILAAAVGILTLSVKALSGLDWSSLVKGLVGVGSLLVGIAKASGPLSKSSGGLIKAGLGISSIAIAMRILASAVGAFGGLSWAALGKGLGSVAIALGAIGGASRLFPSGMVRIGLGLIGVSTGLKLLAGAVSQFGHMAWGEIAKGLVAVAGSLLIIAAAMKLMPTSMVAQAAGLLLVAAALQGMGKAIASFGGMSIASLAKGIGTLALSLGILATALIFMEGSIAGAAALAVAAASIALLAPALTSMGKQSWGSIIKGMVELAATMVILGAAGALLTPVAPSLLALGAAMLAIGGGLALAGAGIALIGTGLSQIAIAGPAAMAILLKALEGLMAYIPKFVHLFVNGFVQIVTEIGKAAPKFVTALGQILDALFKAVIKAAPGLAKAFDALMKAAIKVIEDNFPNLVSMGMKMLIALLKGIKNNIGKVVTQVAQIITTLLRAITNHLGQIQAAGANALAHLLKGVANNIKTVLNAGVSVVTSFLQGIANNLGKIIKSGANVVSKYVGALGDGASKLISAGGKFIEHIITGVGNQMGGIVRSASNTMGKFISQISSSSVQLVNKGAQAILNFMNGVKGAINRYEPQMISAGFGIGSAIVQGMINGVAHLGGALISRVENLIASLPSKAMKLLHIGSPSKVFFDIGKNVMLGLTNGIVQHGEQSISAVEDVTNSLINTMSLIPASLSEMSDMNPVITPVIDLTQVKAGANQMNGIITTTPVVGSASYGQAASISSAQADQSAVNDAVVAPGATAIKFEQNNYSPESLSPIDIYRQTKNQLSQAKQMLAIA